MAIQERLVEYDCDGTVCEGYLAWDDAAGPAPGVLVSHAWGGRSAFEEGKARDLAARGYVGFALDVYGKGRRGSNADENGALMTPFIEDRAKLRRHLESALATLREQPEVDADRCAGMGYCFGGLCMLDLARSGALTHAHGGVIEVQTSPQGNTFVVRLPRMESSQISGRLAPEDMAALR